MECNSLKISILHDFFSLISISAKNNLYITNVSFIYQINELQETSRTEESIDVPHRLGLASVTELTP